MNGLSISLRGAGVGLIVWFAWIALVVGFNSGCPAPFASPPPDYLAGFNVVPPTDATSNGSARFELDEERNELTFIIAAHDLSGSISAARLHQGSVGENGPVVADLTAFVTELDQEVAIVGTIEIAGWPIEDPVEALTTCEIYVVLSTEDFPDGELRGQVLLDPSGSLEVQGCLP